MRSRIPVISALIAASSAGAQTPSHRDIHLYSEAGALRTGAIDFDSGGMVIPGVRAFRGWFGEVANGTNDPGFNASPAAFPQGTLISFNILDALRKWDGDDFDSIPAERLVISLGANNRQTPTTADTFVAGFNITAALADGSLHQHINFFLTTPFSAGVYLLKIEARAANIAEPCPPIYLVFNQNSTISAHESAFAYVEGVLLAPPACTGDANGDSVVNFADLTSVLANFGFTGAPGIEGDADRNGVVEFADVTFILTSWGNACP